MIGGIMLLHNDSTNPVIKVDPRANIIEVQRVNTKRFVRVGYPSLGSRSIISSGIVMSHLKLVLIVIIFGFIGRAYADGDVFDQLFRYTDKEHRPFFQGAPGESVDPFTGNLRIVHGDLVLLGKAG